MEDDTNLILVLLAFLLSSVILIGLAPNLSENQLFFVFAISVLAFSLITIGKTGKGNFQGLRGAKGRNLALVGIILGIIDVGVPYFLLKNTVKFWANYLFWTIFTLIILILGIWQINKWGEK